MIIIFNEKQLGSTSFELVSGWLQIDPCKSLPITYRTAPLPGSVAIVPGASLPRGWRLRVDLLGKMLI